MKKFLALVLVFAVCLSAVSLTAFAGGGSAAEYYLIVGDGIKRDLDTPASGSGWSYNGKYVLTLNNFTGGNIEYYSDYSKQKNLSVIVNGKNTVKGKVISHSSGVSNSKPYGNISFSGAGSITMNEITGCEFTFSQCTATVDMVTPGEHMTLNMDRKTYVKNGATLNILEDNSGGSLSKEKLNVNDAIVNIKNIQQSYYAGKENLTITGGGIINASSNYTNGGFLCRYDSSALSDYLVTDLNGYSVKIEENKWGNISGCLVSSAAPDRYLSFIRISGFISLSKKGHRVDDWAKADINKAIDAGLVPACFEFADLRGNISRADFAAVAVNLYEKMSGEKVEVAQVPFNDIAGLSSGLRDSIGKAYAAGLMNGMSEVKFSPSSSLTREQASTILFRIYTKLGGVVTTPTSTFADADKISSWAKEAVFFMADKGILKGMGNNIFAPQNNTQGQQAIIIALRMLNNLK